MSKDKDWNFQSSNTEEFDPKRFLGDTDEAPVFAMIVRPDGTADTFLNSGLSLRGVQRLFSSVPQILRDLVMRRFDEEEDT